MSKYKIVVQNAAQLDLDEAFIWYEEKKLNLGFRFIEDFENILNKIITNPFFASKVDSELRAASLKIFPYEIVYKIDKLSDTIIIIAINHFKREPLWYKKR